MRITPLFLTAFTSLLFSCDRKEEPLSLFTALTPEETGITFVNVNTETETDNILAYEYFYNGGGVAIGDINNDGMQDLFFTSNQGENKLYLNKGGLVFEDVTQHAGVTGKSGWKTGAAMVDINADGLLDIYVCRSGNQHELFRSNSFYINQGDLKFRDEGDLLGLDDNSYSTQSAFLDFDRDGDLDVFILNHSRLQISNSFDISNRYKNKRVKFVGNRFFRNDNGKFHDVSDSIGVYGPASNYGLGVCYADINNDGWIDMYLSNDYTEKDRLLLNEGGRFLSDQTNSMLSHISQFSMGVDIADINNDGLQDIMTVDMLPESNQRQKEFFWPDKYDVHQSMVKSGLHHQYMRNMLHINNGDGTFSETGQLAGVASTDWSWAPLFADFDNDGLQDLFITNGFKRNFTSNDFLRYQADLLMKAQKGEGIDKTSTILSKMPANATHNYVFRNVNGMQFSDKSDEWGFTDESVSNGAAYADLDNDGDLDLVVNNLDKPAGVYRNNSEKSGNHFLIVKLQGSDKNTFGLGSRVTLYVGDTVMTRTMCPYRGFQSSVEPSLQFGVGRTSNIDSLVVVWPRGERQVLKSIIVDNVLTLRQTDAVMKTQTEHSKAYRSVTIIDTIPFNHVENSFIDFKVQTLLPRMYSTLGPALATGDINNDGLDDIFMGGAKDQASQIFIQERSGRYKPHIPGLFARYKQSEDVDAAFFDMDNDKDADLYVVTGGYEFDTTSVELQDRLYRNDGKGAFVEIPLPQMISSGSCVRPGDVDGDGDLDLFVGGRIVPGRYPAAPASYLLINDGKGNFSDETNALCPALRRVGLVTDALWTDLNGDKAHDLVVTGEWMPVLVFIQSDGKLIDKSAQYKSEATQGWWNCLRAGDFDNDGDQDLIAGNFGMNNLYKPDSLHPVRLYFADYDNNGSLDPLIEYYIKDGMYPMPTRDELTEQLPSFKKRFPDYARYANVTMLGMLTPEDLRKSTVLRASQFRSCYFENNGGTFVVSPLPLAAQVAPVCAISVGDFNKDNNLDVLLGGNISSMSARFGRATGLSPMLLIGNGHGKFDVQRLGNGLSNTDLRKIGLVNEKIILAFNNTVPLIMVFNKDLVK
jgi:hypothetical protein